MRLISVGYDIAWHFPQPTAMVQMLSLHPSRASTIRQPERVEVQPDVAVAGLDHGVGHFRPLSITRQRHVLAYHFIAMRHEGSCQVF
jgi:hypothetical protein